MKTVILCGGLGTRIRDVASDIPKPMIEIGGYPILWHIMKYYAHWGHKQFVLCLGYRSLTIKDFFVNYPTRTRDFTITLGAEAKVEFGAQTNADGTDDWQVTLAETGLHAMTGARVRRIKRYVADDENFMLTYGDGVGNIPIDELIAFHKSHGKILTVTAVRPPGRFGELELDDNAFITGFNEKPQATGGRISGGYFVVRREIFDYLDDREDLVLEQEPFKRLVADGQMAAFDHGGFWLPMDTYRDYRILNDMWDKDEAPWKVW
jgi:glucose-1-phosphate cytidylyltransferase